MKTLYFDCQSGISGNMTLGALLEVISDVQGFDSEEYLRTELAKLGLDGYRLDIERRTSHGIAGTHVEVVVDGEDEYGHVHHLCEHGHHHHEHRSYLDIYNIIESSGITEGAKDYAEAIFYTIAEAESKVHDKPMNEVHFHEVGAIDSIVDVVGTAILLDRLAPERIVSSVVIEGCGFIECAHGKMSVPVPATTEIFRSKGVRFSQTETPTELVTPTGAGIIGTLAEEYTVMPCMDIKAVGYGLGTKDIGYANALRLVFGETPENPDAKSPDEQGVADDDIIVIETNIDDSTGEELGYALGKLLEAGAKDAFFMPIFMKKNRPAYKLSVICRHAEMDALAEIIFCETTSIGVRYYRVDRLELDREFVQAETEYGDITCKRVITPSGAVYVYPEYEDMKRIAESTGMPLRQIRRAAMHKNKE